MPPKPVVKKIKGRIYVYPQGRENGRVVTKCVGPLDRIVNERLM
ncbi:putative integrase [Hyperthermus butylicus]|nr:putative integrase [Hyperthermus butylicus]